MYIENLNIWQFRQNAVGPVSSPAAAAPPGDGGSPALRQLSATLPEGTATHQVQPEGISAGISYLKEQLNNLLTSYPPFFPAGSYQRADLITKVRGIEDKIQEYAKSSKLSNPVLAAFDEFETLKPEASDQEIAGALDRLFAFRDTLDREGSASDRSPQPGLILNTTV
jgi:hypothetical protein